MAIGYCQPPGWPRLELVRIFLLPFNEMYYTRNNFVPYNTRYVIQIKHRARTPT